MKILKEDFEKLCQIACQLNENEENLKIWEDLNEIINNIKVEE